MIKKDITIVGAGLVGSLLSIMLSREGFKVTVFEKRPSPLETTLEAGRSINLALSDRGIKALREAGVAEKVLAKTIPMKGRVLHEPDGKVLFQPYGKEGQQIYSVSRSELTYLLIEEATKEYGVEFHFNTACKNIDFQNQLIDFQNTNGQTFQYNYPIVFGADGAFSVVRSELEKKAVTTTNLSTLEHGYKELHINPGKNGEHLLEKNALHIWPRESFMLIALPNLDGSFTVTLFLAFHGSPSFDELKTEDNLDKFFTRYFPDALALMPDLKEQFFANPTSSLVTIKTFPWVYENSVALIGDAAHAIVPFYGQGMNAGFEDCSLLLEKLRSEKNDWEVILKEYQKSRKKNTDAIAELAIRNFVEMRDLVADEGFLLRKKIEARIHERYKEYLPLYSMVTFSSLPYFTAYSTAEKQDQLMKKIMAITDIQSIWNTEKLWEISDPYIKEFFESV